MKAYSVHIVTANQKISTETDNDLSFQGFNGMFSIIGDQEKIYINLAHVESFTIKKNTNEEKET